MNHHYPICPDRLRSIPEQFSWVDHRLVRDHHIESLSHEAAALYLFLVTVADCQGLSYYSDASICKRLALETAALAAARSCLSRAGLAVYKKPLYQVLSLGGRTIDPKKHQRLGGPTTIAEIFKGFSGGAQ